MNLFPKFDPTT